MKHSSKSGLFALILAFGLLWIPLGQQDFLVKEWMKLGTMMFPFLVFAALSFPSAEEDINFKGAKWIALALLGAYIIHQFEEHWIDVFGNVYAFQASVNEMLATATGDPVEAERPLTAEAIFVINTSLVWLVGFLAIWLAPAKIFPTLAMVGIVLVNGLVHILGGIALSGYNPGLVTSVIVFLPISILAYRFLTPSKLALFVSISWALLAHVIMVIGLVAAFVWETIPPPAYYILLVIWSLIPAFVSNLKLFKIKESAQS